MNKNLNEIHLSAHCGHFALRENQECEMTNELMHVFLTKTTVKLIIYCFRKFGSPLCRAFALSALVIRINDPDGPPPYMNECGKQLGAN